MKYWCFKIYLVLSKVFCLLNLLYRSRTNLFLLYKFAVLKNIFIDELILSSIVRSYKIIRSSAIRSREQKWLRYPSSSSTAKNGSSQWRNWVICIRRKCTPTSCPVLCTQHFIFHFSLGWNNENVIEISESIAHFYSPR